MMSFSIVLPFGFPTYDWKCNFPITPYVRWLVGWLDGWSVCLSVRISEKAGKFFLYVVKFVFWLTFSSSSENILRAVLALVSAPHFSQAHIVSSKSLKNSYILCNAMLKREKFLRFCMAIFPANNFVLA